MKIPRRPTVGSSYLSNLGTLRANLGRSCLAFQHSSLTMRNSTCDYSALTAANRLDCATRATAIVSVAWASTLTIIQHADRRGGDSRSRVPAFGRRYADAPSAVLFTATTGANFLHPAREACPTLRTRAGFRFIRPLSLETPAAARRVICSLPCRSESRSNRARSTRELDSGICCYGWVVLACWRGIRLTASPS